jgi:hypothetical protein
MKTPGHYVPGLLYWTASAALFYFVIARPAYLGFQEAKVQRQRAEHVRVQREATEAELLAQAKSSQGLPVWILTTTYYCVEQTGVRCPAGRAIASRTEGDPAVYMSLQACETDAVAERQLDETIDRVVSPVGAARRASKGAYISIPSDLILPWQHPHVTCDPYTIALPEVPS